MDTGVQYGSKTVPNIGHGCKFAEGKTVVPSQMGCIIKESGSGSALESCLWMLLYRPVWIYSPLDTSKTGFVMCILSNFPVSRQMCGCMAYNILLYCVVVSLNRMKADLRKSNREPVLFWLPISTWYSEIAFSLTGYMIRCNKFACLTRYGVSCWPRLAVNRRYYERLRVKPYT